MSTQIPAARPELASILAKGFSVSSRNRGDEYFRLKRVKVRAGSSTELSAVVTGSDPYEVLLKCSESKLAVSCTCPHFLDHGQACKHLWAAILTADKEGFLADAGSAKGITHDSGPRPAPVIITRTSPAVTPIKPPPPPNWKTQMGRVVSVAASYRKDASPWPSLKEIFYLLDVPKSQQRAARYSPLQPVSGKRKEGGRVFRGPFRFIATGLPGCLRERTANCCPCCLAENSIPRMAIWSLTIAGLRRFRLRPLRLKPYSPGWFARDGACCLWPRMRRTSPLCNGTMASHGNSLLEVRGEPEGRLAVGAEVFAAARNEWVSTNHCWQPVAAFCSPGIRWHGWPRTRLSLDRRAEQQRIRSSFPEEEREEFFSHLLCSPALPDLDLPEQLQYEEVTLSPRKCLKISQNHSSYNKDRMRAELSFEYEGRSIPANDAAARHLRGFYATLSFAAILLLKRLHRQNCPTPACAS